MRQIMAAFLLMASFFGSSAAFAQSVNDITCTGAVLPTILCPATQTGCGPLSIPWNDFIFSVADCPDQTKYEVGDEVGIRMTILTPGIYWADFATTLNFNAYQSKVDACALSSNTRQGQFGTTSSPNLYWPETCGVGTPGIPYLGTDCSGFSGKYKALSVQELSAPTGFFTIPDNSWIGYSYWVIEIPDIRADLAEVQAAGLSGSAVEIKIELTEPGAGGICTGACRVTCEMTVSVAGICSDLPPPQEDCACLDSDADGVPDAWDQCAGTPPGSLVDKNGCPGHRAVVIPMN